MYSKMPVNKNLFRELDSSSDFKDVFPDLNTAFAINIKNSQ